MHALTRYSHAIAEEEQLIRDAESEALTRIRMEEHERRAHPGVWAGPTPVRHRAVNAEDAKRGNLVLLDTRKTDIPEGGHLGEWERTYQLGVVSVANGTVPMSDRELKVWLYQPHVLDQDGKAGMPLWVAVAHARAHGLSEPKTDWESVISLPWRLIQELPLSVMNALDRGGNFVPQSRMLVKEYCRIPGITAYKVQGSGYKDTCPALNVAYVCEFDRGEAKSNQCLLNAATSSDILAKMHARRDMP